MTDDNDRMVLREEVCAQIGIKAETLRRHIKDGSFPKPDSALSPRTVAWKRSTLAKAGIAVPATRP